MDSLPRGSKLAARCSNGGKVEEILGCVPLQALVFGWKQGRDGASEKGERRRHGSAKMRHAAGRAPGFLRGRRKDEGRAGPWLSGGLSGSRRAEGAGATPGSPRSLARHKRRAASCTSPSRTLFPPFSFSFAPFISVMPSSVSSCFHKKKSLARKGSPCIESPRSSPGVSRRWGARGGQQWALVARWSS